MNRALNGINGEYGILNCSNQYILFMPNYTIYLTSTAQDDIEDIYHYIAYELCEPLTAQNYRRGIMESIRKLSIYGGSIAISQRESIQKRWGPKARTITYKKMTIIFNVINDVIYIRRIIAGSLVI